MATPKPERIAPLQWFVDLWMHIGMDFAEGHVRTHEQMCGLVIATRHPCKLAALAVMPMGICAVQCLPALSHNPDARWDSCGDLKSELARQFLNASHRQPVVTSHLVKRYGLH